MNLILLDPDDFDGPRRVVIGGRRLEHVTTVHRAEVGQTLRVGLIGGNMGTARVAQLDHARCVLELDEAGLVEPPPPRAGVILCVAMCRPPTLVKVLSQGAAMGVDRFVLFHARRVEKSFWQSKALAPEAIEHQLRLGLEQARDTRLPEVERCPRFRPFVEDRLPELVAGHGPLFVAHPLGGAAGQGEAAGAASGSADEVPGSPCVLVVGPEGGFVDFEVARFAAVGARFLDLGPRILRVETATVALLARLAGLLRAVGGTVR